MDTICPATHHAERSKARTFRRHLRSWGLWRTTAALRLPIDPRRAARRWIAVRTFPSRTTTRMVARHKMPAGLRVRKRRFWVGRFAATSARSSSRRSTRARDAVALKAGGGAGFVTAQFTADTNRGRLCFSFLIQGQADATHLARRPVSSMAPNPGGAPAPRRDTEVDGRGHQRQGQVVVPPIRVMIVGVAAARLRGKNDA